jgi:hypothetical protein
MVFFCKDNAIICVYYEYTILMKKETQVTGALFETFIEESLYQMLEPIAGSLLVAV